MRGVKIDLLDHGFIRLVDCMGSDEAISRSARISYNAEWRATGEDVKLINYLWKHAHTSPFESCTFTFEVKAPIFVIRQWQRHRMQSYSEQSLRYSEPADEFYTPRSEHIGVQSKSNKQGRDWLNLDENEEAKNTAEWASPFMAWACRQSFVAYHNLIKEGVPRELARTVLPLSTYTHMFTTLNLLNLFKFISLRSHEHAQYEIRVYSDAMLELIRPIVPVAVGAWEKSRG